MSNSISLPFLIIATGTILFVYMSVVIMELRSAYEESFWKQALKIGGIIFTLITLLFLGLDFVLTRFREKAFLLAPGMPILGIILVYMRSIALAWRWRKRNPSHALIRMKRRGGFLKAVGAVILSVDGVPIQKSKAAVVVGKSVYILPGEHRLEMAGYTLRHQLSNIPSFPSKGKQQERTVRFTGGRRYILRIFRGRNWKNMASELDTDRYNTSGGHNIRETKAIITAFARHKLTDDFPDNLDTLDLPLDYSYFKKRETRLSGGVITNGKKEIPIRDIRRVKCVTNGTISNLCIYTTDKGRFFFDMPKMTVTLNALTVPLLEAVMTRNTGHGIDFSRGDGFGQSTSEFVIIRYLDSGYFLHKDGTAHEDWQKTACDRTAGYGYDLKMLMQE